MKIKECPFCGKEPSVGYNEPIDGHGLYNIECRWCVIAPATPDYALKKEAVEVWNTRHLSSKIEPTRISGGSSRR